MSSKLQDTLNQHGGNIQPVLDRIQEAQKKVLELQAKRDKINAEIAEERAAVKALGISKNAFDYALKRSQMDPDKRSQLDQDCSIACDAMGVPIEAEQGDMFETTTNEEKGKEENGTEESIGEQQAKAIKSGNA